MRVSPHPPRRRANVASTSAPAPAKKKLSYKEAREYAAIEQQIAAAESRLAVAQSTLNDPAIQTDAAALIAAQSELEQASAALDQLLTRWTELGGSPEIISSRKVGRYP